MLYTVAEVADLTNLSKVSIYQRIKLKELKEFISRKQGVTYISEVGVNSIDTLLTPKL